MMAKWVLGLILIVLLPGLAIGSGNPPLKLVRTFPMAGVRGHFDHLEADVTGHRLFVAAEDQHAVEVLDLRTGRRLKELRGLVKPHAIVFLPRQNELFVTDGGAGELKVFQASTYRLLKTIKLQIDADSAYYDNDSGRLFVVSGGADAGQSYSFISVIDTRTLSNVKNIRIPNDHLEAIRLDGSDRLFANVTGANEVGVVDLARGALTTTWPLAGGEHNTPMDIDRNDHRLFVVTRRPAKFFVLDTQTGKIVASLDCSGDADDMVYAAADHCVLVSCGAGFINIYRQLDPNHYVLDAKIPSAPGAKTSLWVPSLHRYYVAAPAQGSTSARILVFQGLAR
ncbi:MAG: hypothetical protein KGM47_02900 [Acidobacteriota bacterium]|nr:hypothetical protein [Acidobacteriota bacterium]